MGVRSWLVGLSLAVTLLGCMWIQVDAAVSQNTPPLDPCAALSLDRTSGVAGAESLLTQLQLKSGVLPGGAVATIEIPAAVSQKSYYCGRFLENKEPLRIVSAMATGAQGGNTTLQVEVPDLGFGMQKQRTLVIAAYPFNQDGTLKTDAPVLSLIQEVKVSNGLFSFGVALAAVVLAYLIAVLALGKVGKHYVFDPVYLTSGFNDSASLSQFQIFSFTLLVLGLLVFILMRTSVLSDISSDVLLLLGISAAGTTGSKITGIKKNRLSFDNWSWLRNNKWLTAYEPGLGKTPDAGRAKWSDLLKTNGSFDIYSFQLATFSFLVGVALLKSDISTLATFHIPQNLLALLGLSNGVYVVGKAISPNSIGELDDKLEALRAAESAWISQVADTVKDCPKEEKQQKAIGLAPDKYQAYIGTAREAAFMLKSLYNAKDETKFTREIEDEDLMPKFP
ncbi:MAG: hypothetical protein P4L42_16825 [Desulfocapsaceae bacterium]|nr:hypothetical protein [Desulfocapsaceae bacterium]